MPSFHAKMQSKLRTEAMGADTAVWLAVSAAATKQPSGLFFQGQTQVVPSLCRMPFQGGFSVHSPFRSESLNVCVTYFCG